MEIILVLHLPKSPYKWFLFVCLFVVERISNLQPSYLCPLSAVTTDVCHHCLSVIRFYVNISCLMDWEWINRKKNCGSKLINFVTIWIRKTQLVGFPFKGPPPPLNFFFYLLSELLTIGDEVSLFLAECSEHWLLGDLRMASAITKPGPKRQVWVSLEESAFTSVLLVQNEDHCPKWKDY